MGNRRQNKGFSLTEVLLAVGTLAVGMVFISGTFLTGIHFSTIATERSYAAVVADEAFAKIKVYGINFTDPNLGVNQQARFELVSTIPDRQFPAYELAYPSTKTLTEKQYEYMRGRDFFRPMKHHVQAKVQSFYIDAAEVTNAEYKTFLEESGCRPKHPENF